MLNFSTIKVGGIRFFKLGRWCFSFCITRAYRPLTNQENYTMTKEKKNIPIVTKAMRDKPYSKLDERKFIKKETKKFLNACGKITYAKEGQSV